MERGVFLLRNLYLVCDVFKNYFSHSCCMKEVVIIGTMHNMFPEYKNEFRLILEKVNPDQIIVEIDEKDLDTKEIETYPKEMVFAYRWDIKNKKQVGAFDVDVDLWKTGVTQEEEDRIEKNWFVKYGKYDWKFFNKDTSKNRLEVWTIDKIIDQKKMGIRQQIMIKNIKKMSIEEGKILIITGAYHLDFFAKYLKDAIFPYR